MERAQRGDAISQRALLRRREDMTALHTTEETAGAIVLEDEVAMAMWTGFEQEHGGSPFCSYDRDSPQRFSH
jgi:hypothetical protein